MKLCHCSVYVARFPKSCPKGCPALILAFHMQAGIRGCLTFYCFLCSISIAEVPLCRTSNMSTTAPYHVTLPRENVFNINSETNNNCNNNNVGFNWTCFHTINDTTVSHGKTYCRLELNVVLTCQKFHNSHTYDLEIRAFHFQLWFGNRTSHLEGSRQ